MFWRDKTLQLSTFFLRKLWQERETCVAAVCMLMCCRHGVPVGEVPSGGGSFQHGRQQGAVCLRHLRPVWVALSVSLLYVLLQKKTFLLATFSHETNGVKSISYPQNIKFLAFCSFLDKLEYSCQVYGVVLGQLLATSRDHDSHFLTTCVQAVQQKTTHIFGACRSV